MGFAITLALNISTYFIFLSLKYLPWLLLPTMITFSFNIPIIFEYRASGMSWTQLRLFQFAPGWTRLLYLLTFLYCLTIPLWIRANYPQHFDQTRHRMVVDAPHEMGGRFATAVLMVFWAATLATQSSRVPRKLNSEFSQNFG